MATDHLIGRPASAVVNKTRSYSKTKWKSRPAACVLLMMFLASYLAVTPSTPKCLHRIVCGHLLELTAVVSLWLRKLTVIDFRSVRKSFDAGVTMPLPDGLDHRVSCWKPREGWEMFAQRTHLPIFLSATSSSSRGLHRQK